MSTCASKGSRAYAMLDPSLPCTIPHPCAAAGYASHPDGPGFPSRIDTRCWPSGVLGRNAMALRRLRPGAAVGNPIASCYWGRHLASSLSRFQPRLGDLLLERWPPPVDTPNDTSTLTYVYIDAQTAFSLGQEAAAETVDEPSYGIQGRIHRRGIPEDPRVRDDRQNSWAHGQGTDTGSAPATAPVSTSRARSWKGISGRCA